MTEYSRLAKSKFISTGAAKFINLPFIPDFVEIVNYSSVATPANHGVPFARWDALMGQGFATEQVFNATPVLTTDIVTANGISTFSAGTMFQYGPVKQVVASTKASPTSFQVTAHGYNTGDIVVFEGLYSTQFTAGMPQMSGMPFVITRVDANNFTVLWDSTGSNYTALAASPSGATVKKVLYPFMYVPGDTFISAITRGTTTTIVTTAPHNMVVGQEVAFRIPNYWGTIELNSVPNIINYGSPIYGYVVTVTDNQTVVVNIDSSSYTAFNVNQPVNDLPGTSLPQMVAVGDVNTGGFPITATSELYPSPIFPTFSGGVRTMNGPSIQGAFVNNTRQGFVIGAGVGTNDASSSLVGANGNVIYWRAFLHDYSTSS